jgi:hypothetical protein
LSSTSYKILSNIILSLLTAYIDEITGIISVDFDIIDQPLIIFLTLSDAGEKVGGLWDNTSTAYRLQ